MTPVGQPGFQVLRATVEPDAHSDYGRVEERESHFVIVLKSRFELRVDNQTHMLKTGQSVAFTTPCSYGWCNQSHIPAVVLWVFSPPAL
ncbi:MAG TPA: cupin domain-containing protein [Solirubrobacteraceae bacterium]|nr:cupin domain-containing protein [Solirubrobacteraceae bacterium]